jgi:SAM-dependent methyltransferase
MSREQTMDVAQVKKFWDSQAANAGLAPEFVTHRDHQQRLLEIHIVQSYLRPQDRLLDVGCGNGFATALFAAQVAKVLAVDYSAGMIERACAEHAGLGNVRWEVQDALKLDVPAEEFDVAVTLRCIINLGSWEAQQTAIRNIHKALRNGGLLLLGEGSVQGRAALNRARVACGLPAMPPVAFNLDLDEDVLWKFLREYFDVLEIRRLGLYDFISRVIHPLLVQPDEPRYDAKINEIGRFAAERLDGFSEIGREFIAVLRKK